MHDKRMGNLVKKFGPSKSQIRPTNVNKLEKSNEDLKLESESNKQELSQIVHPTKVEKIVVVEEEEQHWRDR